MNKVIKLRDWSLLILENKAVALMYEGWEMVKPVYLNWFLGYTAQMQYTGRGAYETSYACACPWLLEETTV